MKYLLLLNVFFISCSPVKKQTVNIKGQINEIYLDSKKIYMVCRGTHSKSVLIAENFNIKDRNITHCGIGFIKNDVLCIFNVSDIQSNQNCLVMDSLNSFQKPPDVYYLSIWECKVNAKTLKHIQTKCENYSKEKIDFDYNFLLNNGNAFYCSEFCSMILNDTKQQKFNFIPLELPLNNGMYEAILKRKVLKYFPVDFFEDNEEFKKIYEWKL